MVDKKALIQGTIKPSIRIAMISVDMVEVAGIKNQQTRKNLFLKLNQQMVNNIFINRVHHLIWLIEKKLY